MQFGDNWEALYFIADTVKEKNEWMSKLKRGKRGHIIAIYFDYISMLASLNSMHACTT